MRILWNRARDGSMVTMASWLLPGPAMTKFVRVSGPLLTATLRAFMVQGVDRRYSRQVGADPMFKCRFLPPPDRLCDLYNP